MLLLGQQLSVTIIIDVLQAFGRRSHFGVVCIGACPAWQEMGGWAEKPVEGDEGLEGIATTVDSAASLSLARGLVKDFGLCS